MHHRLPATPSSVSWGNFTPGMKPALTISPGDRVTVETLSGGHRNLPGEGSGIDTLPSLQKVMASISPDLGPHIMTGPIQIDGAEVGDRLIVEIEEVDFAQDYGWNAIEPGFGIFPQLPVAYENLIVPIDRSTRTARTPWGATATLNPFFGIMAVQPDPTLGRLTSVVPGPFGGNIDNKYCRSGGRIDFPVFVPGAGFMVGDGHAAQGDGEICDTALETALNGTFKFSIEKGTAPEFPEISFGDLFITMAFDEDLNKAAVAATDRMMGYLETSFGLSRSDAYRHCSLFADLRITQMVNRKKGVHCVLNRSMLICTEN